jgi:hypothetical protein
MWYWRSLSWVRDQMDPRSVEYKEFKKPMDSFGCPVPLNSLGTLVLSKKYV